MAHPTNAYAFNEMSIACCDDRSNMDNMLDLLDRCRAWLMHEPGPLVAQLKADGDLKEACRGRRKDKVLLLLEAHNRADTTLVTPHLSWGGKRAAGLSAADRLGGWALSWPCQCPEFGECDVDTTEVASGKARQVRHAASISHLMKHWQRSSKEAKKTAGRPTTVQRVDNALNNASGEIPQVHFTDGTALNIDGVWKHGERKLSAQESRWLVSVGWVLPV